MSDYIPDLQVDELMDGGFQLTQANGTDEPETVDVHPLHIRLLAERAGLLDGGAMTERETRVERTTMMLAEAVARLRAECPPEVRAHLDCISALAALLLAEFMGHEGVANTDTADDRRDNWPTADPAPCTDNPPFTDKCECTDKSAAISGAPDAVPKRGRPPTGDALSNTERSRHRRAKLAGKPIESLPLPFEAAP